VRDFDFLHHNSVFSRALAGAALSAVLLLAPGCPLPSATSTSSGLTTPTTAASSAPTVLSGGTRAVKIIFKQNYPAGSFDASPNSGTPASPGSGQAATRFFNPDGSLLASAAAATWLSSFEIGISGSNNASAKNSDCAKFADATEGSANSNCNFGGAGVGCGAPNGLFRISEYDCKANVSAPTLDGTGGPNDGVYLRATFNRSQLGTGENLMAVLEYVASAYDAAPASPTTCFNSGTLAPENCSNVTWKAFVKHSVSEMVQPFLMLVPPTENYVNTGMVTSGVSPKARQFFIPLASDPLLSVLQISRIHSNLDITNPAVKAACYANTTGAANSPLCAGLVLYSLTLYRM
jgi:hypothetical protein